MRPWALFGLCLVACGTEATPPPPEPAPRPPGALAVEVRDGAVYRWADGDWIARVRVVVDNGTDAPAVVPLQEQVSTDLVPFEPTDAPLEVPARSRASAELRWFASGEDPAPEHVVAADGARIPLRRVPAPPAPEAALGPERPVAVEVTVSSPARCSVDARGDRVCEVRIRLANTGRADVRLPASFFGARAHGVAGTRLPDPALPVDLPAGRRTTVAVRFRFEDYDRRPGSLEVRVGAEIAPLGRGEVPARFPG
jgi:hypothetical protein